ncbi:MAG TPA: hypothetical protein VFK03_00415 [Candidatus Saccharimonadales bacterium]|nr:hypothetical protein [Candidatus Saccharimonadales bacterium]
MANVVFIGGFGSNHNNIADAVKALSHHYGQPVTAYTFRQAQSLGQDLLRRLDGAHVVTHSAGMLLVPGSNPALVLAVAPPRRMPFIKLTGRFLDKERRLIASRRASTLRRQRVDNFYRWAMHEHLFHPRRNLLMATKISQFDAVDAGRQLADAGIPVNLVFFEGDSLFWPDPAKSNNPRIISGLSGQHDELLVDPISVLNELYDRLGRPVDQPTDTNWLQ